MSQEKPTPPPCPGNSGTPFCPQVELAYAQGVRFGLHLAEEYRQMLADDRLDLLAVPASRLMQIAAEVLQREFGPKKPP